MHPVAWIAASPFHVHWFSWTWLQRALISHSGLGFRTKILYSWKARIHIFFIFSFLIIILLNVNVENKRSFCNQISIFNIQGIRANLINPNKHAFIMQMFFVQFLILSTEVHPSGTNVNRAADIEKKKAKESSSFYFGSTNLWIHENCDRISKKK